MSTNNPPRNLPRFLPTLTEVVNPRASIKTPTEAKPDMEETVSLVMGRVDRVLERRIREEANLLMRSQVAEHLEQISARLRSELELLVRQAVSEAFSSDSSTFGKPQR